MIQPKNGACRISMVTKITLYSEKNTGICTTIGRQPDAGLTFSALYSAIISGCIFCGSSLNRSFSSVIFGASSFILLMER